MAPTSTQPTSRAALVAVHAGARANAQATTDTAHVWELPRIHMRAPAVGHSVWSQYGRRHAHAASAFCVRSQRWHLGGSSWQCWWHRPAATAVSLKVLTARPTTTSCWHSVVVRQTCGHTATTPVAALPPGTHRRVASRGAAWAMHTSCSYGCGCTSDLYASQPDGCPSQASWVQ